MDLKKLCDQAEQTLADQSVLKRTKKYIRIENEHISPGYVYRDALGSQHVFVLLERPVPGALIADGKTVVQVVHADPLSGTSLVPFRNGEITPLTLAENAVVCFPRNEL